MKKIYWKCLTCGSRSRKGYPTTAALERSFDQHISRKPPKMWHEWVTGTKKVNNTKQRS